MGLSLLGYRMLCTLTSVLSVLARILTPNSILNMSRERTFIAVKPDGVQRGLIGEIIKRFEQKGFKLAGMKFMQATKAHLEKHYEDLAGKPFILDSVNICLLVHFVLWFGKVLVL